MAPIKILASQVHSIRLYKSIRTKVKSVALTFTSIAKFLLLTL